MNVVSCFYVYGNCFDKKRNCIVISVKFLVLIINYNDGEMVMECCL